MGMETKERFKLSKMPKGYQVVFLLDHESLSLELILADSQEFLKKLAKILDERISIKWGDPPMSGVE